ncbi:hypothetical protein AYK24_08295 [Thermoplasmatales archaeon SG8-52-4]|nr:MAG: hypothetical protein AYK24_08295 [Thermoplasmatales archaeon SG8-52-4]
MKKGNILKQKKFLKTTKITIIIVLSILLISSSSVSVNLTQEKTNKFNNIENNKLENIISDGLAPRNKNYPIKSAIKTNFVSKELSDDCNTMYGYNAYPGPESTIFFDTCEPGTIEVLAETMSSDFLTGGTYGCDGVWYACQYGNGLLYGIDPYSGDMKIIGGGGAGLNGLAYNPIYNRMYGCSNDYLYEIDPDTGEQELIGAFGNDVLYMIGIAFDADGVLYGWDLGNDKLWSIDTESGEATELGSLEIDINYAQDGDFDRETDTLYLTAYTNTGQLYTCDKETGKCTLVGDFQDGMEVTASMFIYPCEPSEHDISLRSIDYPETGRAEPDMPMKITVKNTGNNSETFDAQMEIITNQEGNGSILLDENFSGIFPPEGWETDCWEQCWDDNDGYACFNTYCQSYDYSITSKPVNASEYNKCNIRFKWGGFYGYYGFYVSIFVKIRMNSTSPWKDVTPWDNPVGGNQESELYEIGVYSFGEPLGEAIQIKWEPFGYYYYFEDLFLDDVVIEGCKNELEYAELVEDITLDKGEEAQIEFPEWTPSFWQNESAENTWKEYFVHAFVILEGDENPKNNDKWKTIDLWFPWMHDIEVMSIDSPHSDGEELPGQTYPVQVTIRNVGQYAECCIPIDVRIGNLLVNDTLLYENNWTSVPPEGWHDQHKDYDPEYGWRESYTSYSGGSSPEAYIPYYYCKQGFIFYSYAIDASEYSDLRLRFKTYIDHYSGEGLYLIEAGYSTDCENWYAAWSEAPGLSGAYKVDVPIEGGSDTLYIGFWVKGNPYYFNYWYIDNIELVAMDLEEEYYDHACQGPDIEPGEEVTFTFEDWAPAFLSEEKTDIKDYIIEAEIECETDKNPGNDIKSEFFTLEFWHDVGIDEISSPPSGHDDRFGDFIYDNGEPDGVNGLFFGYFLECENWLIDDFTITQTTYITGIEFHFIWGPGYSSNMESVNVIIVEDTDDCDPDTGPYYYQFETDDFVEYNTGQFYFSRPEVVVEAKFEGITLKAGRYFIGLMPEGVLNTYAYWLTTSLKNCVHFWFNEYLGYPKWTPGTSLGYNYDLSWAIYGYQSYIRDIYIQPGTEDINAIVMNYGTFPKYDLTCYAKIWEFITDPENGVLVYTDEINDIDLVIPLGGYKELEFDDYTFADEGCYRLIVNLPASPDDVNENNNGSLRVNVDDTEPESDYPPILDPPEPDGCNGWYVSDVEVILNATDPFSNNVSSGVKEIRYTINGGAEQVIEGSTGSFVITQDGEDILVEYWAVDWVGNVESPKKSFSIDIDQTSPEVSLSYEIIGGNKLQGWDFEFSVVATDEMSGIWYVEFYLNEDLQETIYAPDPFIWAYTYYGGLNLTVSVVAYDYACNSASDEIIPKTSSNIFSKNNLLQNYVNRLYVSKVG